MSEYPIFGRMVEWFLAVSLLVTVAWLLDRLARRRAALRCTTWTLALLTVSLSPALILVARHLPWHRGILAPVAVATPEPIFETPIPVAAVDVPTDVLPPLQSPLQLPTVEPVEPIELASPIQAAESPTDPWRWIPIMLLGGWLVGMLFLLSRLAHGLWRMRQLVKASTPLMAPEWDRERQEVANLLGVPHLSPVCASRQVSGPVVVGTLRPRVLLPQWMTTQRQPSELRPVLVHEFAHIVRHDPWVRLAQRSTRALFWVHPAIHVLNRRLDQTREDVCDDYVMQAGVRPVDYAETLLRMATVNPHPNYPERGLPMIAHRHDLERRITDILNPHRRTTPRLSGRQRLTVAALFALVIAAGSTFGLHRAEANEEPKTPPAKPAATKPAEGNGVVTGTVVDADGKPVAEADVRLQYRTKVGNVLDPAVALQRVTSNAEGQFSFPPVKPGDYALVAFAGNSSSRTVTFRWEKLVVATTGNPTPVKLTMKPGVTLKAKVLAKESGQPIKNARLHLGWFDGEKDYYTNEQGEVDIQALTADTWNIQASAPGFALDTAIVNLQSGKPGKVEFRLLPGGVIEGRVNGPDGKPLAGVGISNFPADGSGSQLEYQVTKADGAFRFGSMPLTEVRVSFTKDDYAPLNRTVLVKKSEPSRLDVVLERRISTGVVRGVVQDQQGKPIPEAKVENQGNSSRDVRKVTANERGEFVMNDPFKNHHGFELVVSAKGFAPQRVKSTPGTADKPGEVMVTLAPGHTIAGKVVDSAGKPIAKAWVGIENREFFFIGLPERVYTDAEGNFQFDSLPAEAPLAISREGYSKIESQKVPLDGKERVVITMQPAGVVVGRVVDSVTGKPVTQFNVCLTFSPDRRPGEPGEWLPGDWTGPGLTFSPTDGQFKIGDAVTGMPLQVSVTAKGYHRKVVRRYVAQPAPTAKMEEFKLEPQDPAKLGTVGGKITFTDGKPVSGVEVRLIVRDPKIKFDNRYDEWSMAENGQVADLVDTLQFQKVATNAEGRFQFRDIPEQSTFEVFYWGKGVAGRLQNLERKSVEERNALEVKAPLPVRIKGTIDRTVYPDISVIVIQQPLRTIAKLGADGKSFEFELLPPNVTHIGVNGPNERIPNSDAFTTRSLAIINNLDLKPGEVVTIEIGEKDRVKQP
jgi:beta-lactamase regulating signal transducer with metallopeptidase domain/uncharacterized GH25 family protein